VIEVAALGAAAPLVDAGLADAVENEVTEAVFDDATDTWRLTTVSGNEIQARVVVDGARTLHQPPEHTDELDGPSFHWSQWDRTFEPKGKRVAVIGDRANHVIPLLKAAEVLVFDCPLTLQARNTKRRWLPRVRSAQFVTSSIDRITPSGIRTIDGKHYDVDAIVYATGSVSAAGLPDEALVGSGTQTIQHAWRDGAASYLGVAVHGFPNYFTLRGPDSPVGDSDTVMDQQLRYIVECLQEMRRRDSTRIEVRRSAQQLFTERARVKPPRRAFDRGESDENHQVYDGPATLTLGSEDHGVRVRLTGHLDPIDGKYHWQGTIFGVTGNFPRGSRPITISTDTHTADARITERTPWGSYSIAGVGTPPYPM